MTFQISLLINGASDMKNLSFWRKNSNETAYFLIDFHALSKSGEKGCIEKHSPYLGIYKK